MKQCWIMRLPRFAGNDIIPSFAGVIPILAKEFNHWLNENIKIFSQGGYYFTAHSQG